MSTPTLNWQSPGAQVSAMLRDTKSFVRGLRGPVGSGKSVGCCIAILRHTCQQKPDAKGVRRTRWAVVRNTNPELKTTTIKTWREWFNDDWGKFNWSPPYTHHMRFALPDETVVEAEVIFLALDRPQDIKKLLSLELTGVWINEAREITKDLVDACTMRVGRFPAVKDGGPTWYGVIMDTNSPAEDHWWGVLAGEVPIPDHLTAEERLQLVKPEGWTFYTQPAAMLEELDSAGNLTGYTLNPERENKKHLDPDYYPRIITGKTRPWIRCYVLNRYETLSDGKPVYPTFRREVHVAKEPIAVQPELDIRVGIDFGRTPAAIFGQQLWGGRWTILHELVAQDMGAGRFADLLKREIARLGWAGYGFVFHGDPAGSAMAQTDETTPFMILRQAGINARPAPSNDPEVRIEAVESLLNRLVDGQPGLLIAPSCTTVIAGFEGGYQFRRLQVSGVERYDEKPSKNRFSHPHDALQYLVIGGGEGRRVTVGKTGGGKVVQAKTGFDPFNRGQPGPRSRLGGAI
jgi:hypothetical protein